MSYPTQLDMAVGNARGWDAIIKYGHNSAVGATFVAVNTSGSLQLPTPSGAAQLQAVSTSAADGPAGAGARSLRLRGLNAQGEDVTEDVDLDGTTPTSFTATAFWRLQFVDILTSGTYSTVATGSHIGDITVSDGVNAWAVIDSNGYPHSRWQSSWYTVPARKEALISQFLISGDGKKEYDIKFLARTSANDEASPHSPMVELFEMTGISETRSVNIFEPFGGLPALTDFGFVARYSSGGTASISAAFSLILRDC